MAVLLGVTAVLLAEAAAVVVVGSVRWAGVAGLVVAAVLAGDESLPRKDLTCGRADGDRGAGGNDYNTEKEKDRGREGTSWVWSIRRREEGVMAMGAAGFEVSWFS